MRNRSLKSSDDGSKASDVDVLLLENPNGTSDIFGWPGFPPIGLVRTWVDDCGEGDILFLCQEYTKQRRITLEYS